MLHSTLVDEENFARVARYNSMSERGEALSSERERTTIGDHRFCIWVLLLPLVLILSLRKLQGFLPYGFFEENSFCLLSLVFIAMHVILSLKDPKIIMLA